MGAAKVAALEAKEAAENAVEASQIVWAAKVVETLGADKVAARIAVEGANEPEQLKEIFEFEEAAQIDFDPEQLNKIFKVEEASKRDPE